MSKTVFGSQCENAGVEAVGLRPFQGGVVDRQQDRQLPVVGLKPADELHSFRFAFLCGKELPVVLRRKVVGEIAVSDEHLPAVVGADFGFRQRRQTEALFALHEGHLLGELCQLRPHLEELLFEFHDVVGERGSGR